MSAFYITDDTTFFCIKISQGAEGKMTLQWYAALSTSVLLNLMNSQRAILWNDQAIHYPSLEKSCLPVYSYESKSQHAGWADQHVEQGWEIAPNNSKNPFSPDGAGDNKRQHQYREQKVGEGQAEHKLVAQREKVRLPIEGDNNHQVAQTDENSDDNYSNGLCDSDCPVFRRGEVPQDLHVAEGGIAAHGQSVQSWSSQDMLSSEKQNNAQKHSGRTSSNSLQKLEALLSLLIKIYL